MSGNVIGINQLSDEIQSILSEYHKDTTKKINGVSRRTAKRMVEITQVTAPENTGNYKTKIDSKLLRRSTVGDTYVWYVKAPDYRLSHLLEDGHETRNPNIRTQGTHFIADAREQAIEYFNDAAKEALT